jgi:hypothetical protein
LPDGETDCDKGGADLPIAKALKNIRREMNRREQKSYTIWLMAQKEIKASFPHCRLDGGIGRMSSLIHGDEDVPFVVGTCKNSMNFEVFILLTIFFRILKSSN